MSRRNIFILIVLIVLFGGLAYYAISPLFRNKEVQDALPEQTVKTIPVSPDTDEGSAEPRGARDEPFAPAEAEGAGSDDSAESSTESGADEGGTGDTGSDDSFGMTQDDSAESPAESTDKGSKELMSEPPQEETPAPVLPPSASSISIPTPVETKNAPVIGTFGHPAEGVARVIETAEGTIVRFENFKTINGPKLHVYLSKDLDAKDFVDLGPIRGTSGNINYAIPADIDISEYKYVLHWCVPFRVLFNSAEIN